MIDVGLCVVHQVGVGVVLDRLSSPEEVPGSSGVALWDNNVCVRFPGPEKVTSAGVPGRGFGFL